MFMTNTQQHKPITRDAFIRKQKYLASSPVVLLCRVHPPALLGKSIDTENQHPRCHQTVETFSRPSSLSPYLSPLIFYIYLPTALSTVLQRMKAGSVLQAQQQVAFSKERVIGFKR